MKKKRGQVTVFIILGFIVVISMGLLFAANITPISAPVLYDTKVKEYVTGCLEQYTNDGLELIGRQGGKLISDENDLSYEGYKVAYGIKKSDSREEHYPYRGALIRNSDELKFKNYFGNYVTGFDDHLSFLTPLCNWKEDSPNYFNIEGAKKTCETYGREDTIQDYLTRYLKEKMDNCDVANAFPEYNIKEEEVNIKVIIGEDDLIINVEYPIEASKGETKKKLLDFSINPKVRLKKIHELASHLIGWEDSEGLGILPRGDVTNLFFDIIRDAGSLDLGCRKVDKIEKVSCLYPGMEIIKVYNVCPSCSGNKFDDILNITDKNSIINGKPFTFLFAIENRRPALDYIEPISLGETVEAFGYDPDDGDVLKYNWYKDGTLQSEHSNTFTYTYNGESLTVEVCDNDVTSCDSQDI